MTVESKVMNCDPFDLGFVVGIDTFCSGGGLLTALDTATGQYWQANQQGLLKTVQRDKRTLVTN